MINYSVLKDRLALDRRSFTELATSLSIIAVAGATLYNLGFFAPIEWSLISLLTVQDLLIGTAVAAVPMAVATWVALLLGNLVRLSSSRMRMALVTGLPTLVVSGYGFFYFYSGPGQSTLGHLASGYLLLWVAAMAVNIVFKSNTLPTFWLVLSLLYIPTAAGMSDSAAASSAIRPISEIETDRELIAGRIVRITSTYLLVSRGNEIITMPMSKVREVRRQYIQSPESDFLGRAAILSPKSNRSIKSETTRQAIQSTDTKLNS